MKELVVNDKVFLLQKDVFKFLHDYLERINTFVRKNQIDTELYQDILQIFEDKLSLYEDASAISQKDAIQIVNELGEPEEIFAESLEYAKEDSVKSSPVDIEKEKKSDSGLRSFYQRLQDSGRSRPQESALLLWVYAMFARKLGINVRVLRGLLFVGFLLGLRELVWFSLPVYFLLAFIFPRTEKNYGNRSVLNYFLTQIWDFRLIFVNGLRFVWNLLIDGLPKGASLCSRVFCVAWKIARFMVLVVWCLAMFWLIVGLGVWLYYLFVGFVRSNIDVTSFFPSVMKRGVILGLLSAGGFLAVGLQGLLREKIKSWILISSLVLWAGAMSIAAVSIVDVLSYLKNPYKATIQKELTIPITDQKQSFHISVEGLNDELNDLKPNLDLLHYSNVYNFFPTDKKDIRVVFNYDIQAKNKEDPKLIQIKDNLNTPVMNLSGNNLNLQLFKDQLFAQRTPFLPMRVSVDLYIPKHVKFDFSSQGSEYYHSNLKKPDRFSKYLGYLPCTGVISYQSVSNAFYCDVAISPAIKKALIEQQIETYVDTIAPFVGKNWEYSFMDEGDNQYWKLHSMRWIDDHYLLVKLSDQFFNLFVKVKVDLDKKGNLTFDHVQLQDLEQKGLMNAQRIKAYDKLDQLSGFNLDMQDEEQELLSKIVELEKKLDHLRNEE